MCTLLLSNNHQKLSYAAIVFTEQGLALLGYLKNVCRQLNPNIVLKVEVKTKS